MESRHDHVYREARASVADFSFDEQVATVFDDMVARSVPFYAEIQRMVAELARDFAAPGSALYDLGCSSGTSLFNLHRVIHPEVRFVGVDNSQPMLEECRSKLAEGGVDRALQLLCLDLNDGAPIENASVVLLILTLQFIRPLRRERLMQDIVKGLQPRGCLLLVEKVLGEHSLFNRLFIDHYYQLKRRNGYSELEIAQKREALENVLVPYKLLENRELLLSAGFSSVDVFFKWYNFCGLVAVK